MTTLFVLSWVAEGSAKTGWKRVPGSISAMLDDAACEEKRINIPSFVVCGNQQTDKRRRPFGPAITKGFL